MPSTSTYPYNGQNVVCAAALKTLLTHSRSGYSLPGGYTSGLGSGCTAYGFDANDNPLYVPMYLSGQLACERNAFVINYFSQSSNYSLYQKSTPYYAFGSDYYYQYPPYSGAGCSGVELGLNSGGTSLNLCFGEY